MAVREETRHSRGTVYVFFDKLDRVLYVGVTNIRLSRLEQHALSKDWWFDAAHVELHHCISRNAALRLEAALIRDLNPIHNRQGLARMCVNCGDERGTRKGLCVACYAHKRRTGEDRPEALIVKNAQRRWGRTVEEQRVRRESRTMALLPPPGDGGKIRIADPPSSPYNGHRAGMPGRRA